MNAHKQENALFFTRKRLTLYLGALVVLQSLSVISGIAILRTPRGHYIDFRTFYTAGYMLRTHQSSLLYDYATEEHLQSELVSPEQRALPMMSPPFTALLFEPLSHLSFHTAYIVFVAVNILLLFACIPLLQPFLTALSARWRAAPTLLLISFLPACMATLKGQISIVLLLLYCAVFVCLRRNRDLIAGLLFSLALMKFQIALPIAFLFLVWRQWRFLAGFLLGSTALTALSIRIIGLARFGPYLHSLWSMTSAVTTQHIVQAHLGILPHDMPNLYGLVFILTHGAAWCHTVTILLSAALILWGTFQRPSLPLALCVAILVSYHLFFYDLTLLFLPLTLLFDHLLRNQNPAADRSRKVSLLATQISLGILFLGPLLRAIIAANDSFWLAVPILGLTLCSPWCPELHGAPEPAPLRAPAAELAPNTSAAPPLAT